MIGKIRESCRDEEKIDWWSHSFVCFFVEESFRRVVRQGERWNR
jgi:hypothetical protein